MKRIELPSWLVACNSLIVLKLNLFSCALDLPYSMGFNQLNSLDLSFVKLLDDNLTGSFFSNCPLLENLSLIECVLKKLKILEISANNLKNLTIESFKLSSLGMCKNKLRISYHSSM